MTFRQPYQAGFALICIWGICLAACAPVPASAASENLQPCTYATPGANTYRNGMMEQVRQIYLEHMIDPGGARNRAFSLLVDQVERWSSTVDVLLENGNFIRLTVTYISPELTQIIILNHQLYKNTLSEIEFEQMLQNRMNAVAVREETLFLMTVTYTDYDLPETPDLNPIRLRIPMQELALVNSRNTRIPAYNIDPPLRQEIVTSRGPSAGYIAFPIGVRLGENCVQSMESRFNTVINIQIGRVVVNGTDYAHPLAWTVKYHPLVDMDNGIISPPVTYVAPLDGAPIEHSPPIPVTGNLSQQAQAVYWQEMALHVWGYVTDP